MPRKNSLVVVVLVCRMRETSRPTRSYSVPVPFYVHVYVSRFHVRSRNVRRGQVVRVNFRLDIGQTLVRCLEILQKHKG